MSNTLLALSHKAELGLHARVVADLQATAEPLGVAMLIAGAFARDLHLHHAWGVPVQRQTGDVDFALAVNNWAAFELLRGQLINTINDPSMRHALPAINVDGFAREKWDVFSKDRRHQLGDVLRRAMFATGDAPGKELTQRALKRIAV